MKLEAICDIVSAAHFHDVDPVTLFSGADVGLAELAVKAVSLGPTLFTRFRNGKVSKRDMDHLLRSFEAWKSHRTRMSDFMEVIEAMFPDDQELWDGVLDDFDFTVEGEGRLFDRSHDLSEFLWLHKDATLEPVVTVTVETNAAGDKRIVFS